MRGLLPKQVTRTVRLHLDTGAVLEGLLVAVGADAFALRGAALVRGGNREPLEGETLIPRPRVVVVELAP